MGEEEEEEGREAKEKSEEKGSVYCVNLYLGWERWLLGDLHIPFWQVYYIFSVSKMVCIMLRLFFIVIRTTQLIE